MILANILPNDALRKDLNTKLATFLFKIGEIPTYDIVGNIDEFVEYVKTGNSGKLKAIVLEKINKEIHPSRKEMLEYIKKHTNGDEAFELAFTLYYYDNEKDEYFHLQKKVLSPSQKPMRINRDFFKMLKGKMPDRQRFLELAINELMITAYKIYRSERFDLVSKEEWETELSQQGMKP